MGHGNTLIMNIQAQPLEETAARVMSHVLTVVRRHFLGLLEDCISKREGHDGDIYLQCSSLSFCQRKAFLLATEYAP